MNKKHYLYVLYNKDKGTPVYIGVTQSLKQRVLRHEQSKDFDGVIILETFNSKKEALTAERSLIKFLSIWKIESVVNGLYLRYDNALLLNHHNQLNKIKNGGLD
jgi:predicted GIY-YIG superfamily endonuclease